MKGMPPCAHCPEESHTKIPPWDGTPTSPRTLVLKLRNHLQGSLNTECWVPVLPPSPPQSFRFTPSEVGPAKWNVYQVLDNADADGWEPHLKNCCLRRGCSELLLLWDSVIWRLKGLRDPEPHLNPAWLGLQCSGRGWSRLEILK